MPRKGERKKACKHGLDIDHCHITGKLRGILCHECNIIEGMMRKKPERVALVLAYVARKTLAAG